MDNQAINRPIINDQTLDRIVKEAIRSCDRGAYSRSFRLAKLALYHRELSWLKRAWMLLILTQDPRHNERLMGRMAAHFFSKACQEHPRRPSVAHVYYRALRKVCKAKREASESQRAAQRAKSDTSVLLGRTNLSLQQQHSATMENKQINLQLIDPALLRADASFQPANTTNEGLAYTASNSSGINDQTIEVEEEPKVTYSEEERKEILVKARSAVKFFFTDNHAGGEMVNNTFFQDSLEKKKGDKNANPNGQGVTLDMHNNGAQNFPVAYGYNLPLHVINSLQPTGLQALNAPPQRHNFQALYAPLQHSGSQVLNTPPQHPGAQTNNTSQNTIDSQPGMIRNLHTHAQQYHTTLQGPNDFQSSSHHGQNNRPINRTHSYNLLQSGRPPHNSQSSGAMRSFKTPMVALPAYKSKKFKRTAQHLAGAALAIRNQERAKMRLAASQQSHSSAQSFTGDQSANEPQAHSTMQPFNPGLLHVTMQGHAPSSRDNQLWDASTAPNTTASEGDEVQSTLTWAAASQNAMDTAMARFEATRHRVIQWGYGGEYRQSSYHDQGPYLGVVLPGDRNSDEGVAGDERAEAMDAEDMEAL